mmetsp:Transcript_26867/g.59413  ORF Transcript_26867/g.59413 Transcript_26867/m.59413 type:complete len:287 (-) Transcript_26867:103-963(-)
MLAHCRPVQVGVSHDVGIEIPARTVEFPHELQPLHSFDLPVEPPGHNGTLLAKSGRCRRLPVCQSQHGHIRVLLGQIFDLLDQRFHLWQHDLVHSIPAHQAIGQVVDVLRCATKMGEFHDLCELLTVLHLFFDVVLDRLHIMVGDTLVRLDPLGSLDVKLGCNVNQCLPSTAAELRHLRDILVLRHLQQPGYFHLHSVLHQPKLGENLPQPRNLGSVSPIDWANSRELGQRQRLGLRGSSGSRGCRCRWCLGRGRHPWPHMHGLADEAVRRLIVCGRRRQLEAIRL